MKNEKTGSTILFAFCGKLLSRNSDMVRRIVREQIDGEAVAIYLDFHELLLIDSICLGTLVDLKAHADKKPASLKIFRPSENVSRTLKAANFQSLFEFVDRVVLVQKPESRPEPLGAQSAVVAYSAAIEIDEKNPPPAQDGSAPTTDAAAQTDPSSAEALEIPTRQNAPTGEPAAPAGSETDAPAGTPKRTSALRPNATPRAKAKDCVYTLPSLLIKQVVLA